jgi:hypothetical protein
MIAVIAEAAAAANRLQSCNIGQILSLIRFSKLAHAREPGGARTSHHSPTD